MIIAIEGIDGSGKGTQTTHLLRKLTDSGYRAAGLSFPRYGTNPFAAGISQYLNGAFGPAGDVAPQLAAALYAGDRFCSRHDLTTLSAAPSILVCDRYVDSNIAHQAAKLPSSQWASFIEWIESIEYGVFDIPRPAVTIFLDVPVDAATNLIAAKAPRTYTALKADAHESDADYLGRTALVYQHLAQRTPGKYVSIDCRPDGSLLAPAAISALVWSALQRFL